MSHTCFLLGLVSITVIITVVIIIIIIVIVIVINLDSLQHQALHAWGHLGVSRPGEHKAVGGQTSEDEQCSGLRNADTASILMCQAAFQLISYFPALGLGVFQEILCGITPSLPILCLPIRD